MKKIYGILFLIALVGFKTNLQAQTPCDAVTVIALPQDPQSGAHNYFAVRATLTQAFGQDVTVTGFIHKDADENNNQDHPFSITITG